MTPTPPMTNHLHKKIKAAQEQLVQHDLAAYRILLEKIDSLEGTTDFPYRKSDEYVAGYAQAIEDVKGFLLSPNRSW